MLKIKPLEVAYCLISIGYTISLTFFPANATVGNLLIYTGLSIMLLRLFKQKYKPKIFWTFCLIGVLLTISAYRAHNYQFLYAYIVIFAARNVDFTSLIKKDIVVRIGVCLVTIVSCALGLINNRQEIRANGTLRQSLGFSHPNNLGAMIMVLTVYWFFLKHKKFKAFDYLLLLFFGWTCWSIVGSRTSSLVIFVVIFVEYMDSCFSKLAQKSTSEKIKRKLLHMAQVLIWGIPAVSIYLGLNYKTNLFYCTLDSFLTDRLYLLNQAIKNNGISIWGKYVKVIPWSIATNSAQTNAIDNLYGYLLVNFGIVFFLIVINLVWMSYRYALKTENRTVCLCILFFVIAGFCENKMFYIGCNVFTLYIANAVDVAHLRRTPCRINNLIT